MFMPTLSFARAETIVAKQTESRVLDFALRTDGASHPIHGCGNSLTPLSRFLALPLPTDDDARDEHGLVLAWHLVIASANDSHTAS